VIDTVDKIGIYDKTKREKIEHEIKLILIEAHDNLNFEEYSTLSKKIRLFIDVLKRQTKYELNTDTNDISPNQYDKRIESLLLDAYMHLGPFNFEGLLMEISEKNDLIENMKGIQIDPSNKYSSCGLQLFDYRGKTAEDFFGVINYITIIWHVYAAAEYFATTLDKPKNKFKHTDYSQFRNDVYELLQKMDYFDEWKNFYLDHSDAQYDMTSDYGTTEKDYFDAMTDGTLGDYEDFEGDSDDLDNWSGR
jgi:hypothetical protein